MVLWAWPVQREILEAQDGPYRDRIDGCRQAK